MYKRGTKIQMGQYGVLTVLRKLVNIKGTQYYLVIVPGEGIVELDEESINYLSRCGYKPEFYSMEGTTYIEDCIWEVKDRHIDDLAQYCIELAHDYQSETPDFDIMYGLPSFLKKLEEALKDG